MDHDDGGEDDTRATDDDGGARTGGAGRGLRSRPVRPRRRRPPAAAERPNPLPGVTKSMEQLEQRDVPRQRRAPAQAGVVAGQQPRRRGAVVRRRQRLDGAVAGQPRLRGAVARRVRRGRRPAADPADARSPAGAGVVLHPGGQRRPAPADGARHPREEGARDRHPRLDSRTAADLERRGRRAAAARPVAGTADQADGQAAGRLPGAVVEVQQVHDGPDPEGRLPLRQQPDGQ